MNTIVNYFLFKFLIKVNKKAVCYGIVKRYADLHIFIFFFLIHISNPKYSKALLV